MKNPQARPAWVLLHFTPVHVAPGRIVDCEERDVFALVGVFAMPSCSVLEVNNCTALNAPTAPAHDA